MTIRFLSLLFFLLIVLPVQLPAKQKYKHGGPSGWDRGGYGYRDDGWSGRDGRWRSGRGREERWFDRARRGRSRGLDRDGDGVIHRGEWRGNNRSFSRQDRNRDGIISDADRWQRRRGRFDPYFDRNWR